MPLRRRAPSLAYILALFAIISYKCDHHDTSTIAGLLTSPFSLLASRSSFIFINVANAAPTHDNKSNSDNIEDDTLEPPPNYYQLLDLETPTTHRRPKTHTLHNRKKRSTYRSKITNDQIKKAYRKQAQLYHPDKLAARRKRAQNSSNNNATNTNSTENANNNNDSSNYNNDPLANMTIEEATSRFAQIAEAYQVLSDQVQRYEYDWELLEMEEEWEEERLLMLEERQQRERQQQQQQQYERQQGYNDNGGYGGDDSWSLYDRIKNGASNFHSWKDTLNLDPWAVFEDFFFQESTMGGVNSGRENVASSAGNKPHTDNYGYDSDSPSSTPSQHYNANTNAYYNSQNQPPRQKRHSSPRISETTLYRGYDPKFGAKVYTVLRREDFIHETTINGEFYYQILGQDFIAGTQVDPYTGFTLREYYSAVTEPYLVEEGYTKEHHARAGKEEYLHTDFHQQQNEQPKSSQPQQIKNRLSPYKLEQGESLTPDDASSSHMKEDGANQWISPNGKYEAILTPTCELQIVRHDEHEHDVTTTAHESSTIDTVTWSSETYVPPTRAHGCHLALSPLGKLTLSVDYGSGLGSADHGVGGINDDERGLYNTVLWSTPMPHVVPHWFQDQENGEEQPVTFRYYASLDDDGVIAVYRVRESVDENTSNKDATNEGNAPIHESPFENPDVQAVDEDNSEIGKATNTNNNSPPLRIPPILEKLGHMYQRLSKASVKEGQTKAALAWDQLRYNVGQFLIGRPWSAGLASSFSHGQRGHDEGHESSKTNNSRNGQPLHHPSKDGIPHTSTNTIPNDTHFKTRHECVYATSPAGCLAPGRNAIHLTTSFARSLKRSVKSLDAHLDHFLDLLTERVSDYDDDEDYSYGYNPNHRYDSSYQGFSDDDDEDILDTLIRVTGSAGMHLGRAGIQVGKVAQVGLKHGKKVAGKVVGRVKERAGMHSNRWGERMEEKEHVDEFF